MWGETHQIDAVEIDPEIAKIYQELYPDDKVIVMDAHEFLKVYYKNFDFIWSSPPCQTHSSFRQNICVRYRGTKPEYPDMRLYQEIIFLRANAKCKWVVENVKPYYEALIKPDKILQRHYFWSNFEISDKEFKKDIIRKAQIPDLQRQHGINLAGRKIKDKRQLLRNCVLPELGQHILKEVQ
jgi:DNA (cytosine-5)-methyltransferase 1